MMDEAKIVSTQFEITGLFNSNSSGPYKQLEFQVSPNSTYWFTTAGTVTQDFPRDAL
jgi:hypothetical protein